MHQFFRPIGGGIIEAERAALFRRAFGACSSALLGAASLKPLRGGQGAAHEDTFFRPIGGGIIEACVCGRPPADGRSSSALLGAASLKPHVRGVSAADVEGRSSALLGAASLKPFFGGGRAVSTRVLPPYWGRHH